MDTHAWKKMLGSFLLDNKISFGSPIERTVQSVSTCWDNIIMKRNQIEGEDQIIYFICYMAIALGICDSWQCPNEIAYSDIMYTQHKVIHSVKRWENKIDGEEYIYDLSRLVYKSLGNQCTMTCTTNDIFHTVSIQLPTVWKG